MTLPTAEDFGFGILDEKCAREHFLGRTLDEAEEMFREKPQLYFEDLLWMGPAAFRFYFPAAVRALLADAPSLDLYYGLHSFAHTLKHRLSCQPTELHPVAKQLAAACSEIILAHEDTFVAHTKMYRKLRSRYVALQDVFTTMGA